MILQSQVPGLRTLPTAHLAQTMSLLSLPALELRQKIEAELAANPALEVIRERRCPSCRRRLPARGPCPICSHPASHDASQPIVFVSPSEDFARPPRGSRIIDEMPDQDFAASEGLPAYVLRQIAPELDPEDRSLAAHILTSLDEDGLLGVTVLEIARYHHVLPSRVEEVLQLIQRADPAGVGASSPQEALLVQLAVLSETRPVPKMAEQAIREGMELLSRRSYQELGRLLSVTTAQAREIAQFISENLYPYPARAHWGETGSREVASQAYYNPDVIISCLQEDPNSPLVVEIISPYSGALRVNPMFKKALIEAPREKAEEWQSALDSASLLVKCLQQREHTLVRLMTRLANLQRSFLLFGDAFLAPVTRASLAKELQVHESTISRAVTGKALQLPNRRIVPLSKLFDRSLHIRTALREIIAAENEPLSDARLGELLSERGFDVARRTVAKYRAMEGILPARMRQMERMSI